MRTIKKLLKHPIMQAFFSWLMASYIRLVVLTSRVERDIHPDAMPYVRGEQNAIFAFWHGRMMLLPAFCPPMRAMHVMISHHRDGKFISDIIAHFGQQTISGSSSKGGRAALVETVKLLNSGANVSITPDGPRGPMQKAAQGVSAIAKLSARPVLPCCFIASRHKRFYSWDRFVIAYPFSRIIFSVGAPIMVDRNVDDETSRLLIETRMNEQVAQTDAKLL